MKVLKLFFVLACVLSPSLMQCGCTANSPTATDDPETAGNVSVTQNSDTVYIALWPWQFNNTPFGCGFFRVYVRSDSGYVALAVKAIAGSLDLSKTPQRFDLSVKNDYLHVSVDVFNKDPREWCGYCNDWIDPFNPIVMTETWEPVSGVFYISTDIDPPLPSFPCYPCGYNVTITIDSLVVRNPVSKKYFRAPSKIEINSSVGGIVG